MTGVLPAGLYADRAAFQATQGLQCNSARGFPRSALSTTPSALRSAAFPLVPLDPGTTLGATNSLPQHEVEHHGCNHQGVEREEDDEQALGAGVHGRSRCRLRGSMKWWNQGLRATRKPTSTPVAPWALRHEERTLPES